MVTECNFFTIMLNQKCFPISWMNIRNSDFFLEITISLILQKIQYTTPYNYQNDNGDLKQTREYMGPGRESESFVSFLVIETLLFT